MALLDISKVTEALMLLVQESVSRSDAWLPRPRPVVSPLPPEKLDGDALGIFLYHLTENAGTKNLPAIGADEPPIRYTPMGLNLYYLLYASHSIDEDQNHLQAQRLLGCAVKTFHDFPVINDATCFDCSSPTPLHILDKVGLGGADNRIRLTLQPIPHTEAMSFWTAGTAPPRPSAYYEASIVLLEPEEPRTRTARVLTFDVRTVVGRLPHLDGSRAAVHFRLPGTTDTTELVARPAIAAFDDQLTFTGTNLAGDETHLLIRGPSLSSATRVDANWSVVVTPESIMATIRETVDGAPIPPGIHAASARVVRKQTLPDGSFRMLEQVSNETPFTVAPRIDAVNSPVPANTSVWTVIGHLFYRQPDIRPDNVHVYVGSERLARGDLSNPGQFEVIETIPNTLNLTLPAGFTPGAEVPLRIIVNGAESSPRWITAS